MFSAELAFCFYSRKARSTEYSDIPHHAYVYRPTVTVVLHIS